VCRFDRGKENLRSAKFSGFRYLRVPFAAHLGTIGTAMVDVCDIGPRIAELMSHRCITTGRTARSHAEDEDLERIVAHLMVSSDYGTMNVNETPSEAVPVES
jgi:hypothetical protein